MILDTHQVLLFATASLALNLTPGADMLFCLAQGARSGSRLGVAASLGITTGSIVHVLVGGLGLAAILAAHPAWFDTLRWAGVGYLVWLAVRSFRADPLAVDTPSGTTGSTWRAWRDGTLVNLLNPKVIVFVLAFVPQFVKPENGSAVLQFLLLGAILVAGGQLVNGLVGLYAGRLGKFLHGSTGAGRFLQRLSGTIFLALAAKLAFERR